MAARVTVEFNESVYRALINGPIRADTEKRARRVKAVARSLCPKDTRRLERSIDYTIEGLRGEGWVATVGSDLEYAIYQEKGTGIYGSGAPIRPRNGEWLQWVDKSGRRIRAREVAGSPGRHFLELAVDAFDT